MVGRMCLALTITLAFPMLVIPARDILLRSVILPYWTAEARTSVNLPSTSANIGDIDSGLEEPLLSDEERGSQPSEESPGIETPGGSEDEPLSASFTTRLVTSIGIFWTAGLVASCVASIDIVWDLLGSSLSILLSFLIPCGCYLCIMKDIVDDPKVTQYGSRTKRPKA